MYLAKISASSKFLLGLINDILDMSKIENGNITLNPEPLTKKEFVVSINTVIRPLMDQRNIHFICQMDAGPDCILVDKLRFNQIFFNLLSNAGKFTPEGGEVLSAWKTFRQKTIKRECAFMCAITVLV